MSRRVTLTATQMEYIIYLIGKHSYDQGSHITPFTKEGVRVLKDKMKKSLALLEGRLDIHHPTTKESK